MGEDFGTWIPQLHRGWQPPDPNSMGVPLGLGQNFISGYGNPGTSMIFPNGTLPAYASSDLPQSQIGRPSEPHGWFYCLPRIRQAFMPTADCVLKEKPSPFNYESVGETLVPNADPLCEQNRFLVNNPSGEQTALVFGSGIVDPLQGRTSWNPNPQGACYLNAGGLGTVRDLKNLSGAVLTDELKGNDESGAQSEMHEDTEELNALMYSDGDSDYTDDDEVTSTGHSPSTMAVQDMPNWSEGRAEQVASSDGMTNKKRKLFEGGYDDLVPSVMDTVGSMKPNRSLELEDDAESSCACNRSSGLREVDSLSSNKRMKKEKIRETVSILQNIIPNAKGRDAIVVLDEAIHYLKSLKLRAMTLGLESL